MNRFQEITKNIETLAEELVYICGCEHCYRSSPPCNWSNHIGGNARLCSNYGECYNGVMEYLKEVIA